SERSADAPSIPGSDPSDPASSSHLPEDVGRPDAVDLGARLVLDLPDRLCVGGIVFTDHVQPVGGQAAPDPGYIVVFNAVVLALFRRQHVGLADGRSEMSFDNDARHVGSYRCSTFLRAHCVAASAALSSVAASVARARWDRARALSGSSGWANSARYSALRA